MIPFQPRRLFDNWKEGFALDLHTLESIPLGYDEYGHLRFETRRSGIGEALYRLKYRRDISEVPNIAEAAREFLQLWQPPVDILVPVPPSATRPVQPVIALATAIAEATKLPTVDAIERTRDAPQLKEIYDLDERLKVLDGLHRARPGTVKDKRILLFDDLYRSGATMNAISKALTETGGAVEVFVFAITRTRSHH